MLYVVLITLAVLMLIPFAWMLSASLKLDKDVFIFPIQWIPKIQDGRIMLIFGQKFHYPNLYSILQS